MFTDIVGSTTLAEALGNDSWERLLRWHDEVLRGLGSTLVATPDVYAYANGPRNVAVRFDTDHVVVTSTTLCR